MSEWLIHTGRQLLDPALPLLPAPGLMQASLCMGWGLVLAAVGTMVLGSRLGRRPMLWLVPLLLALWPWLPGTLSASYWLALAFQAPSLSAVLLSVLVLHARWAHPLETKLSSRWLGSPMAWTLVTLGVVLGWVLLLDTFAVLPVQLYDWGFSPAAAVVVVALALAPWALLRAAPGNGRVAAVVPLAVALYVLLRLPSGNLWDAVLDPWLWLVLQLVVLRKLSVLLLK